MRKRILTFAAFLMVLCLCCGCSLEEADLKSFVDSVKGTVADFAADGQKEADNNSDTEEDITLFPEDGIAKPAVVEGVSEGRYVYGTLTDEEKTVYDEVLDCIMNHTEKVTVNTLDQELLGRVYNAVCADYGGLFWVEGYVYTTYTRNNEAVSMEFAPKYTMTKEERDSMQASIDVSAAQILSGLTGTESDYEKAKYVFTVLARDVEYDKNVAENQNIISVFIYHATVCQGYASATQYLLNELGIQSFIVTGRANNENHAWNVVRLDGEYYYMDTTWGNSTFINGDAEERFINYNYLNVTTEEIERTHQDNGNILLPECTAVADNYFVREGLYFAEWTPEQIQEILGESWNNGKYSVSLKFATAELYARTKQYFIEEQHIVDCCPGINSIQYIEDTSQNVLTLSF